MKRGYTYAEALVYLGIKRSTFDELWRPRLVAMQQGNCLIFDRADLDRVFDEFKRQAAGEPDAANDAQAGAAGPAHNGPRNGRPNEKGATAWARRPRGSIPKKTAPGPSTESAAASDFASVASRLIQTRRAG